MPTMTRLRLAEALGERLDRARETCDVAGDSPDDVPMLADLPNAVGVAGIGRRADRMGVLPIWVTARPGGRGLAEPAQALPAARRDRVPS
jgi:predicted mannosyl-3-phosphoglycerate phosphatase (HAD superfamily)